MQYHIATFSSRYSVNLQFRYDKDSAIKTDSEISCNYELFFVDSLVVIF